METSENVPEDVVYQLIIKRIDGGVSVKQDIRAMTPFEQLAIIKSLKESKDKIFELL